MPASALRTLPRAVHLKGSGSRLELLRPGAARAAGEQAVLAVAARRASHVVFDGDPFNEGGFTCAAWACAGGGAGSAAAAGLAAAWPAGLPRPELVCALRRGDLCGLDAMRRSWAPLPGRMLVAQLGVESGPGCRCASCGAGADALPGYEQHGLATLLLTGSGADDVVCLGGGRVLALEQALFGARFVHFGVVPLKTEKHPVAEGAVSPARLGEST